MMLSRLLFLIKMEGGNRLSNIQREREREGEMYQKGIQGQETKETLQVEVGVHCHERPAPVNPETESAGMTQVRAVSTAYSYML